MPTRSAAVLASGTANAAKLFVAALAFTSAYVGFSAYSNASSAPGPTPITLSAREVPIAAPAEEVTTAAQAGKVTVNALVDGAAGCARSYVARSLLISPDPDATVLYHWRLARWSSAGKTWRTYVVDYDGFAGAQRAVEWRPQISGNPGWYRIELSAEGAKTVKSDRFQVSC
ncbi:MULTISPECIES: hypothetical protein [unclassified Nonomuraea]|uniref:hypothetical protein n=1 Tax=unclassified Nonomuraea TaxID=2593643 RepID=UPI0035BF569E